MHVKYSLKYESKIGQPSLNPSRELHTTTKPSTLPSKERLVSHAHSKYQDLIFILLDIE